MWLDPGARSLKTLKTAYDVPIADECARRRQSAEDAYTYECMQERLISGMPLSMLRMESGLCKSRKEFAHLLQVVIDASVSGPSYSVQHWIAGQSISYANQRAFLIESRVSGDIVHCSDDPAFGLV